MNAEIKTIFGEKIEIDNKEIPVAHLKYEGSNNTFVVWTIISETPSLIGNDENLYNIVQLDIDIYSDSNYLKLMRKIKKLLKANEWIWVEDSSEMYEDDTHLYHRTCTFEKEKESDF